MTGSKKCATMNTFPREVGNRSPLKSKRPA
nr:MAG TPA: hypothetical protein [Caudoviricetes sp.]